VTLPAELSFTGPRPLRGRLKVPGDKGMSHRALLFGAAATGPSEITGLASGDDVERTRNALRHMGVAVEERDSGTLQIHGQGFAALAPPTEVIDCGNSGTTMRMVAGLVAGRAFETELTGDTSLNERPMRRVVVPLRAMGARIDGRDDGNRAPLVIHGGLLRGVQVVLEVPSAQVKTALVLAALQADGVTEIIEPAPSRDHTERMLSALDAPLEIVDERTLRVQRGAPKPFELAVPGDPSSAAFFVVAATITPGSELVIEGVGLNPGRIAYIDALRSMGAHIVVHERTTALGEPVGDIEVVAATLTGAPVVCSEAMIDEVPALAVAAAFADGVTDFRGAGELRVKESDRVATLDEELARLGIEAEARADGLVVRGGAPRATTLDSHGDHRIAMAVAVAANAIDGTSVVRGWQAIASSYPGFAADLAHVTGRT
jgi:3-phosphoshikimate 1-carboxyvinyltransferase